MLQEDYLALAALVIAVEKGRALLRCLPRFNEKSWGKYGESMLI